MNFDEVKRRLNTVVYTIDQLLRNEVLVCKSVGAVQEMGGCFSILSEICQLADLEAPKAEEASSAK